VFLIAKKAGAWCSFCEIGEGCKIYEGRPVECQEFQCAWLRGSGGGLQYRPDKIGVVPEHRWLPSVGKAMWFWELNKGALDSELTRSWTRRNLNGGNYVVHVPIANNCKLYLPSGADGSDLAFKSKDGKEVEIVPFVSGRF